MKRENIKNFRKKVGIQNHDVWGYAVTWGVAMLMLLLDGERAAGSEAGMLANLQIILAVLLLIVSSNGYISKYLMLYRNTIDAKRDRSATARTGLYDREDLGQMLRCHSFDLPAYYTEIVLRFLPFPILSIAALFLFAALKVITPENIPLFIALFAGIPAIVFALRYLKVSYEQEHVVTLSGKIAEGFWNFGYVLIRFLASIIAMVIVITIGIAIVDSKIMMQGISDEIPVRIATETGVALAAQLISGCALGLFLMDIDRDLFHPSWILARKKIMAIMLGVFLISAIAYEVISVNAHVLLSSDRIVVTEWGDEREYGIADIATYRVYGKDQLRMELTFTDGTKTDLFRAVADDTPAWGEQYTTDYQYAAYLTTALKECGITGTIENRDAQEQMVSTLDPVCREGFAVIVENIDTVN